MAVELEHALKVPNNAQPDDESGDSVVMVPSKTLLGGWLHGVSACGEEGLGQIMARPSKGGGRGWPS